jgi:hypothetical protein
MKTYRPAAVLVMAILNLVFGILGLVGTCFGVGGMVILYLIFKNMPPPPPGQPNPLDAVLKMFDQIPGYVPFAIGSLIVGAVFSILLTACGFGLLKVRPWARIGSLVYAVFGILQAIGGTIYTIAVVNPALANLFQQQQAQGGPPNPMVSDPTINNISAIAGFLIGLAYPIAILIVLNLTHVRRAFAGLPPEEFEHERGFTDDDPDDEDR